MCVKNIRRGLIYSNEDRAHNVSDICSANLFFVENTCATVINSWCSIFT